MGGFDGRAVFDDEWEFDGSRWTRTVAGDTAARTAAINRSRHAAYGAAMRSDLRNLVTAQESFFADNVRYSGSLDSLQYRASTGVTVRFVTVRSAAWSAIATHANVPGAQCGIFVGDVAPPFPEVRNEGEPACKGLDR
jgi:hypothetical protein